MARMLPDKPWTLESVLWLGGAILCCLCLGTSLGGGLLWVLPKLGFVLAPPAKNLIAFISGSLSLQLPALGLTALFLAWHRSNWREAFGFGRSSVWRSLGQAVGCSVVLLPLVMVLAALASEILSRLGLPPERQPAVKMLVEGPLGWRVVVYVIGAAVLAPLAEEVLFRGILYPALRRAWSPTAAVWVTSLLFACTHFNLMVLLPMTFLAVALTWIYERTANLLVPILVHAFFNGANLYLLLYPPRWLEPFLNQ